MIKVKIRRKENHIQEITLRGHALFAAHGKDIVCSAVSAIIIGGINAIHEMGYLDECEYKVEEGHVEVKIIENPHPTLQVILETLYIQLMSIEESYSSYISIQEV